MGLYGLYLKIILGKEVQCNGLYSSYQNRLGVTNLSLMKHLEYLLIVGFIESFLQLLKYEQCTLLPSKKMKIPPEHKDRIPLLLKSNVTLRVLTLIVGFFESFLKLLKYEWSTHLPSTKMKIPPKLNDPIQLLFR